MSGIWREKQNRVLDAEGNVLYEQPLTQRDILVRELQKLRDARAHALRTADWMDRIGEAVPDEVYEELIRIDARIKQLEEVA